MSNKEQTIKDVIVRDIAQRLQIPKEKVDAVVINQFKEINRAMASGCNSVEMSGFGVFHYLPVKAKLYMKKIQQDINDAKALPVDSRTVATLETLASELAMIKNHFTYAGESQTNSRRLEEHDYKG